MRNRAVADSSFSAGKISEIQICDIWRGPIASGKAGSMKLHGMKLQFRFLLCFAAIELFAAVLCAATALGIIIDDRRGIYDKITAMNISVAMFGIVLAVASFTRMICQKERRLENLACLVIGIGGFVIAMLAENYNSYG